MDVLDNEESSSIIESSLIEPYVYNVHLIHDFLLT